VCTLWQFDALHTVLHTLLTLKSDQTKSNFSMIEKSLKKRSGSVSGFGCRERSSRWRKYWEPLHLTFISIMFWVSVVQLRLRHFTKTLQLTGYFQ